MFCDVEHGLARLATCIRAEVRAASGLQYIPVGTGLLTIKKAAAAEKFEKSAFTAAYVRGDAAHKRDHGQHHPNFALVSVSGRTLSFCRAAA